MSKNVIFLDLDGPAFPLAVVKYHPDNRRKYPGDEGMIDFAPHWRMCERFRFVWNRLIETREFSVVISSSWRHYLDKEFHFNDLFMVNLLKLPLHTDWKTITIPYSVTEDNLDVRASEIQEWLSRHPEIEDYLIIDDQESGASLDTMNKGWNSIHKNLVSHTVLADYDSGLSGTHISDIFRKTCCWMV